MTLWPFVAHYMLQNEDASFTPRTNHVFSLSWVNHREKIRASQNFVRNNIVRVIVLPYIQILLILRSNNAF